jgi:hypothetical protein
MFLGGWSYPDAVSAGWASTGADVAQAKNAPVKRKFEAFRIGMSSLRCSYREKPINKTILHGLW